VVVVVGRNVTFDISGRCLVAIDLEVAILRNIGNIRTGRREKNFLRLF
jgi:hypothetical protein